MGLLTYLAVFVVLFYGVQLRSVDPTPKYARRYCGANLASELERRCRTKGYNGPEQKTPYLLFQDKKVQSIGTIRSKEKDIIEACCRSPCTEEFLDSYCLSSTPEDDTTAESQTVETTTIVGRKKQRTKKPKPDRRKGRKSNLSDEPASSKDYESQTETQRNRNGRRNKNKPKEEKNKCNKKTLTDKYGKPCTRKPKEDRREKDRTRKNRKRNKKNKPTRRPKRWDSETTTLSDFLLSQRFLQGALDSDIGDQSNLDELTPPFDAVQEGDTSYSLSQESSSNEVISEAQRTEQFRPPFRPIIPAETSEESYDNNMFMNAGRPNTRKGEPSLEDDPVAKLKKIKTYLHISGLMQDSTSSS